MSPFPILFFIFVELPSMGAMLVHKGIMLATGKETKPLNVWLYRLLGVTTLMLLVILSLAIGGNAACLLVVLLIAGFVAALIARNRDSPGSTARHRDTPAPAARAAPPPLPGLLDDLSRRSLDDLRRTLGPPQDDTEANIHLRSADLMAALRFYQLAIDPRFSDHEIGAHLATNAPDIMARVANSYRRLPYSPERDIAVDILRTCLPQGLAITGNVYTTFAGAALRDARRNPA